MIAKKREGENKGTKRRNVSAFNYSYYYLDCFPSALELFIFFDLWLFLFPYWCLTLDFSLTTQCNLNISERAVSTCARLTCLVSRLVLLHFPLNTQIVLPLLSLKATHTDAHTLTNAQLTDTNSTLWHTDGTGQKTQTVVCRLCTEKVLFLMLLLFNKG